MIITTQPQFLPVTTANPPIESARRDARLAERIPQTKQIPAPPRARPAASEPPTFAELEVPSTPLRDPIEQSLASDAQSAESPASGADSAESSESRETRIDPEAEKRRQRQRDDAEVQVLKARDREVRAHEQAHVSVGGKYAGSARLEYERGPDGVNYAIGGEVPISTSPIEGDPAATLAKAIQVQAAALAPRQPSAADRRIAAEASSMAGQARAELNAERAEQRASRGGAERLSAPDNPAERLTRRLLNLGVYEAPDRGQRVNVSA
ncbi:MAG: catalase [Gammaproteobacteria bacterium]|nr:catalase [Gammaproteobacteria bacterium]